jgi:hypothetical protein
MIRIWGRRPSGKGSNQFSRVASRSDPFPEGWEVIPGRPLRRGEATALAGKRETKKAINKRGQLDLLYVSPLGFDVLVL